MRIAAGDQARTPGRQTKIWNRAFVSVFLTNMTMNLGQQMTVALVAKYADHLGASAVVVGLVTGIFALTALAFKLLSGPAIDTYNRKFLLTSALLVMCLSFFGYGISRTVTMLMVFRLLQGAAMAFTATTCLALAADSLPPDRLGVGIGSFSLAQAVCQAIGPALALGLEEALGYPVTFAISGGIILCAVLLSTAIVSDHVVTRKFRLSLHDVFAKEAIIPAVLIGLLTIPFSAIHSFLIIFATRLQIEDIGYFFTVYAASLLFTRPLIGKMTDKLGYVRSLIPALALFMIAFFMISISTTLPVLLAAALVSAFGFGGCQPAIQALAMKSVPKGRRGVGSSMTFIGGDLGYLAGPAIGGLIVEGMGYPAMWRWMSVPIVLAMAYLLANRRRIAAVASRAAQAI